MLWSLADGEDYTYTYATDGIDDGDSYECNSVPIISDSADEEEECFIVSISTSSTYPGLQLHPDIAIVCINDDDRELSAIMYIHTQ